ncbi:MAG: ornithine cyclodeaminase family protein [Ignavibacteria bacterium]
MALYLTEKDVEAMLTMDMALAAVEAAHLAHAKGRAIDVPRQRTRIPTAALHVLQGALPDDGVFGYKAYTTARAGARFLVHLFEAATGAPLAVIEADRLGMMRTGAAGGIAAKWLARQDAAEAGLFGAGWQAGSQIEALCRVRPIKRVKVFSRDEQKRREFCEAQSQRLGIEVVPVASAEQAVRDSDVVVTITSATTPLFLGDSLAPGTHVTAAGSNALIRREIDEKAVQRAARVCVDSRATAVREAGDLLPALEKGRLSEGQLVELGEVVAGMRPGRLSADEITLFESQGMAIQDLAVAKGLLAIARERGLGVELPY